MAVLRNPLRYLFLLVILFTVCLFPVDILLFVVGGGLRLNHVSFESIHWESGAVVVTGGKVQPQNGAELCFETASFRPYFARKLCGDLDVEGMAVNSLPSHTSSLSTLPFFSEVNFSFAGATYKNATCKMQGVVTPHLLRANASLQLGNCGSLVDLELSRTKEADISLCVHLGEQNLPDLVSFLHHFYPSLQTWHFSKGVITGDSELYWQNGALILVEGKITLENFTGENHELAWRGSCDHLFANVSLNPQQLPLWNGLFEVDNVALSLYEVNPEFWQGLWNLDISHSKIVVTEGKVNNSLFEAALMGMKGELFLDWFSPDELLKLSFKGNSQEICPLLPDAFQPSFAKAFPGDSFCLDASVRPAKKGVEMQGELLVCDESNLNHTLFFGCRFGEPVSATLPEEDSFLDSLKEQFFLSHRRLGWFHGDNFPVEKFVSPFLLKNVRIGASGNVDFDATFDDRFLVIKYQGRDFCLESPHFVLESPLVGQGGRPDEVAVHYFDFDSKKQLGILPIRNATYRQKNYDLTFSEGSARICFEDNNIRIEQATMGWQDLLFSGAIDIDVREKDEVELCVTADHITGPVEEAQSFLSHIIPSRVWDLPLKGFVECGQEGLAFRFLFHPKAQLLEGKVHGHLCADMSTAPFSLSQYTTSFAYDFAANSLSFSDGTAQFSWGKESTTAYSLVIPELAFFDFPNQQMSLKMDVSQGADKLFSLLSKTEQVGSGRKITLEGDDFSLSAIQMDRSVLIEQGNYKQFNGGCALSLGEESCTISSLKIAAEPLGTLSVAGELFFADWLFVGDLTAFKIDLGALGSLSLPHEKELVRWNPCGQLEGRGNMTCHLADKKVEISTRATFDGLKFGGISFGDGKDLRCDYTSHQGISVEGLAVELPQDSGVEKYKLGQFHYDSEQHKILFDTFDFSLPSEKLPWITEIVSGLFPDRISPEVVQWALALKQDEPLDGCITVELFPDELWFSLRLKDGTYFFSDRAHTLRNFQLIYDPLELRLSTDYLYQDRFYDVDLVVDTMTMSHGEVAVGKAAERVIAKWERRPQLGWCVKEVQGSFCGLDFDLKSPEKLDFSEKISLWGRVGCDLHKAAELLPKEANATISKLGLGRGYSLSGEFAALKHDLGGLCFNGVLRGEDFLLGQTRLDTLYARLNYQPDYAQLSDIEINDWACSVSVDRATACKENDQWKVAIPHLSVENLRLSRLRSAWTLANKKHRPLFRSLFITSCELHQLGATLGDPDSFQGTGAVQFTNLPKKYFLSPLLYLPTEITARIGLDLSLLVPARGRIDYEFKEGKVFLNKFHHMYSEGKRSRFYLDEMYPAYIDFNGNLHMKVKMKQYNLLMKLAEFFTVTVKGTVFKPNYTFTNQFADSDDDDED